MKAIFVMVKLRARPSLAYEVVDAAAAEIAHVSEVCSTSGQFDLQLADALDVVLTDSLWLR